MMRIQFLGAARQVTGSCYLVEVDGLRILVDCGLFQEREYVSRNWKPFPVFPGSLDFVLLTHSHLDHAGLLPKLVREGYSGPVLTTTASQDLMEIVWLDSARIQEEDAAYKRKRHKKEGRKGPHPEVPLYTVEDAEKCLPLITAVRYREDIALNGNVRARFHDAGHILGAAMIELEFSRNGSSRKLLFSGDIGQWDKPLVHDPSVFREADYVVMESTYGDRDHETHGDVENILCDVINQTVKAGGNVVIPTFAIERAQELMYHLSRLVREDRIPYLMMFLDSPMAVDVTDVFLRHREYLDEETHQLFREGEPPFRFPGLRLVRSTAESKAINSIKGSCVIMAGSGMCTGGRVKHHLVQNIARPESQVLFVGYQARGTLGRLILDGREEVRIHGRTYPVRAGVRQIQGFSAHADRSALLKWLGFFKTPPKRIILTHGEDGAILSLAEAVRNRTGWDTAAPEYMETLELD
jgi:metallo-beta-lactamase family protein